MRLFLILCLACAHLTGTAMAEEESLSDAIRTHRMGTLVVKAPQGAKVGIEQLEHEFWFGTAVSARIFAGRKKSKDRRKYLSVLKENFNSAVHENALKWYWIEKRKNRVSYAPADTALKWCLDNGLRVRGHCVFWGVEKHIQSWIKRLDDDTLRTAMKRHAIDLLTRYKGRISEYDVNNEMLHGDYYKKRFGDTIRSEMFEWCHAADPNATLYVNDYGVLTGGDLDRYEKQIAELIKSEAPIGGIGIQGHFGPKGVDAAKVKRVLDRLAKFNLPIKITEFDIDSEDEDLKAKGLVDLYTTAFANPAVNGILMWGFWEGKHWRPRAALWRRDWTPTKAAEAYRDLVYKKWWTSRGGVADKTGTFKTKAFYGRYKITVEGKTPRIVWLREKEKTKTVDMTAEVPGKPAR